MKETIILILVILILSSTLFVSDSDFQQSKSFSSTINTVYNTKIEKYETNVEVLSLEEFCDKLGVSQNMCSYEI
jgi:hypothetical protein